MPAILPYLHRMLSLADIRAPLPGEPVDWPALETAWPWLAALADCPQEPEHHGEGDVLAHTKLVVGELLEGAAYAAAGEDDRQLLFLTALLHDIGKPQTTKLEDGRLTSRGHSRRGAILARRLLWQAGVDPALREQVCALIRQHMLPFFLVENDDALDRAAAVSWQTRCDLLAAQAHADARGRVSATSSELTVNTGLYEAFCEEAGCLTDRFPFANAASRFEFFRTPGRDPRYAVHEQFRCRATVLSGLPGAGKDTWVAANAAGRPVVSLDDVRRELKVAATDNQGAVIQTAREQAREHLRAGRDFIWNGTNLSKRLRSQVIDLLADYNAHVTVVSMEVPAAVHDERNQSRGARAVPSAAVERMLEQWEPADLTECHQLEVVQTG